MWNRLNVENVKRTKPHDRVFRIAVLTVGPLGGMAEAPVACGFDGLTVGR